MNRLLPAAAILAILAAPAWAQPAQGPTRPNPPACPVAKPKVPTADPNAAVEQDACARGDTALQKQMDNKPDSRASRARSEPSPGNYNGTPGGELNDSGRR